MKQYVSPNIFQEHDWVKRVKIIGIRTTTKNEHVHQIRTKIVLWDMFPCSGHSSVYEDFFSHVIWSSTYKAILNEGKESSQVNLIF